MERPGGCWTAGPSRILLRVVLVLFIPVLSSSLHSSFSSSPDRSYGTDSSSYDSTESSPSILSPSRRRGEPHRGEHPSSWPPAPIVGRSSPNGALSTTVPVHHNRRPEVGSESAPRSSWEVFAVSAARVRCPRRLTTLLCHSHHLHHCLHRSLATMNTLERSEIRSSVTSPQHAALDSALPHSLLTPASVVAGSLRMCVSPRGGLARRSARNRGRLRAVLPLLPFLLQTRFLPAPAPLSDRP